MGKNTTIIAHAPLVRIAKEAGIARVSDEALPLIRKEVEEYAHKVLTQAKQFAQHAGRTTITKQDMLLALRQQE
ncbi:MAG: histone [Candidatus Woesearchaeota archaeon]